MRFRMYSWRTFARFGLTTGLYADGAFGSPASIASASVMSFRSLPKYTRGGREAVRALAEIDLVHVQLENLVLRQAFSILYASSIS